MQVFNSLQYSSILLNITLLGRKIESPISPSCAESSFIVYGNSRMKSKKVMLECTFFFTFLNAIHYCITYCKSIGLNSICKRGEFLGRVSLFLTES